ncbi:MAG: hypothetical protein GTO45_06225 [Candidatus Aminicenantes bacterium]|nr:hypothetical protein [Candidatus Aminicenantes bacterium]NIM78420.1 hypothetical protein [Candidatus Aminicenantes bacterium]NIN17682.1 hypothetical protein [Candidatus Aminicenantes bacterium]NIN41558.1 hypothetical protein [Candidatus Aminicenantes bacterium]NIN84332.1 hypothetical protein [Candidatus Aminicenantes bacterium]
MDNIYKPGLVKAPTSSLTEVADPTRLILNAVGRGLIFAFFFPIFVIAGGSLKLVFLNFLALGSSQAGLMLKFQALYPLLAGIAVLILVRQKSSPRRAAAFLGIALLPVLVLLLSEEVRMAFSSLGKDITGGFSIGLHLIVSSLAIFAMLASAHTIRIEAAHRIAASLAVIGGGLYFLSLLIPVKGKFLFLEPFRALTLNDPTGAGVFIVAGLASLASLALMIYAAVTCFQIQKQEKDKHKEMMGKRIINLWVWHLLVSGMAIFYMIFIGIILGKSMADALLVMFVTALIKFVPWILGLYLLIPLGISEILLTHPSLSDRQDQIYRQEQMKDNNDVSSQVSDDIVFGDQEP